MTADWLIRSMQSHFNDVSSGLSASPMTDSSPWARLKYDFLGPQGRPFHCTWCPDREVRVFSLR